VGRGADWAGNAVNEAEDHGSWIGQILLSEWVVGNRQKQSMWLTGCPVFWDFAYSGRGRGQQPWLHPFADDRSRLGRHGKRLADGRAPQHYADAVPRHGRAEHSNAHGTATT